MQIRDFVTFAYFPIPITKFGNVLHCHEKKHHKKNYMNF